MVAAHIIYGDAYLSSFLMQFIFVALFLTAENLKTLFRPCAMVVPDFALICEIMLVAEGFQEARILARKFITLYTLCKELLSTQDHYDWGLRAIKSVLVVAGALKVIFSSLPFRFVCSNINVAEK